MSTLLTDLVRAELDDRHRQAVRVQPRPSRSSRPSRHRVPRRPSLRLPRPRLRPLGLA
jgi:hypothetical protein